jgi:hypothetical protein
MHGEPQFIYLFLVEKAVSAHLEQREKTILTIQVHYPRNNDQPTTLEDIHFQLLRDVDYLHRCGHPQFCFVCVRTLRFLFVY